MDAAIDAVTQENDERQPVAEKPGAGKEARSGAAMKKTPRLLSERPAGEYVKLEFADLTTVRIRLGDKLLR